MFFIRQHFQFQETFKVCMHTVLTVPTSQPVPALLTRATAPGITISNTDIVSDL